MTENFADYLAKEGTSSTSVFHEFRILYDPTKSIIYSFYEGIEDALYYNPQIRISIPECQLVHFVCDGKWAVIDVKDKIMKLQFAQNKCLFFVDRDFDDYLGRQAKKDKNLYVTRFYSVESEFVSREACELFLHEVAGVPKAHQACGELVDKIHTDLYDIARAFLPYMYLAIALKDNGEATNLNNVKTNKIFQFNGDCVRRPKYGIRTFMDAIQCDASHVSRAQVRKWRSEILKDDPRKWVRGKYILDAFCIVLLARFKASLNGQKVRDRTIRTPLSLIEKKLMDVLGGRLLAPNCLAAFLADARNRFISSMVPA